MATLCFAFVRVLMQIEPKPNYSKELLSVMDSSKVAWLNVASTAESLEILKKVESKIYLDSFALGSN